jgi:hypothetical protein
MTGRCVGGHRTVLLNVDRAKRFEAIHVELDTYFLPPYRQAFETPE